MPSRRNLIILFYFNTTFSALLRSLSSSLRQPAGSGAAGNKFKMSLGLPVGAVMNCADNTGAKNLYIISVKRERPAPISLCTLIRTDAPGCSRSQGACILTQDVATK